MAKTSDTPQSQPARPANGAAQTPPAAAPPAKDRTVTKGQLLAFWSVVALTVAAARILDHLLPGTPESTIERWLMLPFGLFLVYFLVRLK
ncbi:MAG: hypothetical protein NTY45_00390 [Elusimicrobia bacterium]|nr:hypothetical protein [Elusimicrobiota bacterium]